MEFTERLCDVIVTPRPLNATGRNAARSVLENTIAVTYAGRAERSIVAARRVFASACAQLIDGITVQSADHMPCWFTESPVIRWISKMSISLTRRRLSSERSTRGSH